MVQTPAKEDKKPDWLVGRETKRGFGPCTTTKVTKAGLPGHSSATNRSTTLSLRRRYLREGVKPSKKKKEQGKCRVGESMCITPRYGEVEEAGRCDFGGVGNAVSPRGKFSKNFKKCLTSITSF